MEKENNSLMKIAQLTQQLEEHPEQYELRRERAHLFLEMGLLKEAAADLDSLIQLTSVEAVARAQMHLIEGNAQKAEETLRLSLGMYPDSKIEYISLSQILSAQKKYPEALDVLQKGIDRIQIFPEAYKERGRIRMLLNDSKGAMDDLKTALDQDPDMLQDLNGKLTNL